MMCQACQIQHRTSQKGVRDIKRACREGQKKVPSWLAPKRSVAAELTYQLKRLAGNARHEAGAEFEAIAA